MANIVLGVTGSVAAYRACDLARDLMRAGHTVRACLTSSASSFVSPVLFEALTGEPCLVSVFDEPVAGRMAHIDWARWADLVLVAPATANSLADIASGHTDSMLGALISASSCPLVLAPAMNPSMYSSGAVVDALAVLRDRGALVVEPQEGDVACGENGQGKLASNASIAAVVGAVLDVLKVWGGRKVVVSSGPTREMIDDVRFISNRSSGKMGRAVAQALLWAGAEVVIISGPVGIIYPAQAKVVQVGSADEMLAVCRAECAGAYAYIGVAAVADYRPAERFKGKMRRSAASIDLSLTPNPDITAALALEFKDLQVVAFAAEPDEGLDKAMEKMKAKGAKAIAVNNINAVDQGFESSQNQITLLFADGRREVSPHASKTEVAVWLVNQLG